MTTVPTLQVLQGDWVKQLELNPEFCDIAKARITHALTQASVVEPSPQLSLFEQS